MRNKKRWLAMMLAAAMTITSVGVSPLGGIDAVYAEDPENYDYELDPEFKIPDQVWTGKVPDLSKVDELASITVNNDLVLYRGTDYTVEASTSNVGEAKAIFTCIGNYAGSTIKPHPFNIVAPEEVANYTASVDTTKFVYDGDALDADEVKANTVVLKNGNEVIPYGTGDGKYTVTVTPPTDSSKDAGAEYGVKITVQVSATKTIVIYDEKVKIAKRNLATLVFDKNSISGLDLTYNSTEQKPELSDNINFKFEKGGEAKTFAKANVSIKGYKDNINAGTGKVVIEAKADSKNFTGTAEVPFEIGKASLKAAAFVPNSVTVEYNGKDQRPTITGKAYFSGTLGAKEIPSTDYKVVYDAAADGSKDPGTYMVHLEAADNVNNFEALHDDNGEKSASVNAYQITKADLSKATVKLPDGVYTAGTPFDSSAFEVVCNGRKLETSEYIVESADSGKASTVGAKIEATIKPVAESAKYTGSIKYTFTVSAKELAKEYKSNNSFPFDGLAKKPAAVALGNLNKVGDDGEPTLTTADYEVVSWENNTNASKEAIANIRGKGIFEGRTAKVKFTISKFKIDVPKADEDATKKYTAEVSGIKAGNYYNGGSVDFTSVKIMDGTKTVATLSSADCDVIATNISSGILTAVEVTGKGNYSGTLTVSGLSVEAGNFDLTNAVVTGTIPAGLNGYTVNSLKNFITVTVGGKKIENTQYKIDAASIKCATTGKALGDLGSDITFEISSDENDQIIGKKSVKMTVTQRDIADLKDIITLGASESYTDGEYSGKEQKPEVAAAANEGLFSKQLTSADYTATYSNNVNAGTATVTITGKGNYKGTVSKTFVIKQHEVQPGDFDIVEPAASLREYKPGTPDDLSKYITIKAAGNKKYAFNSSDYTVELVPGQTVDGVGSGHEIKYLIKFNSTSNNYKKDTNGIQKEITIVPKTVNLNNTKIELTKSEYEIDDITNNEDASTYVKSVKVDDKLITSGVDAKFVIPEEKVKPAAGKEPYIKLKFTGNYVGVVRAPISFKAKEIDLSKVYLKAPSVAECSYTGSGIEAKATSTVYTKGIHYNVVYRDANGNEIKNGLGQYIAPTDVGKYTATIEAAENYVSKTTGTTVSFEITAPELTKAQVDSLRIDLAYDSDNPFDDAYIPYAGSLTKIENIVVDDENQFGLTSDDFEVVSIDTDWDGDSSKYNVAKLRIKPTANAKYSGIIERKFKFTKNYICDMESAFTIEDQIFASELLQPSVKIATGTNISSDWITVNYYRNNYDVSTDLARARITVNVPEGNKFYHEGKESFDIYFNIKAASIATTSVEGIKDAEYTGKAITQKLVVTAPNGLVLTLGKDYKVAYANNVNPGTATVTISGMGNYTGEIVKTFKITKKDISKATVSGLKTVTYNGKAFKPVVKVVVNGKTLVLNKDYKVAYSNNIKPGTAKVVITGIGSYKGTVTKTFVIKKAAQSITKAVVSKTFKASSLKKKAATFKINAKAKGEITYKKTSGSKNITVSKSGTVTVKKGTKKGTYTIKVKITAAATSNFNKATVTKTIKVVVK